MKLNASPEWQVVHADALRHMQELSVEHPDGIADMIFADPPYFLSNDGITCQSGRMVSVNKGDWDKASSHAEVHAFNRKWLSVARKILKHDGTIWVSGTLHAIVSFPVKHTTQK
jgi:site-specific DNA-methyltransferase (adenine-specific)